MNDSGSHREAVLSLSKCMIKAFRAAAGPRQGSTV